jgi:hypothetical protein
MNRLLCAWLALASISCGAGRIEPTKFEGVDRAARALRLELQTPVDSGWTRIPALLERLQTEIAALNGRTGGRREAAVLDAYAAATESCRHLLRFQRLEREAVGGMVLLTGATRPIASRAGLPTESRGGGRWVDRTAAMRTFAERAATELDQANRLLAAR